ncbi:MAG: Unknown protein [uncultured Sulfurovum sp.]|uniref:SHSP domain-containing protein n=1 Tax=uncultured Sulfurovum sp. TaxID=269237 RepID=A0A6S6SPJ9_9BACT|nr:MAG: Unknown protein [uncultured Sulfurovum sp.]
MFKKLVPITMLVTLSAILSHADMNMTQKNDAIFQHFEQLKQDMDKVFKQFNQDMFKEMKMDFDFPTVFSATPNTDLIDTGEAYELTMDLAGMDKESIKIEIDDNYLKVVAKSEARKEQKEDDKIIHQERKVGMVQRGMTLPKDADGHAYKSTYNNGVLTLKIPKKK